VLVGPDHLLLVFLAAFKKRLSSAVESNLHSGISRTLIQKIRRVGESSKYLASVKAQAFKELTSYLSRLFNAPCVMYTLSSSIEISIKQIVDG
jgi:hypothetical protein